MIWLHRFVSRVRGKNSAATPAALITEQMHEPRPLPIGIGEFHTWAERIIAGAMLPATAESQKFALAEMIMHLKPTQDFCDDAYFIHCLRKGAVNQVAYAIMEETRNRVKARASADIPPEELAVQ